MDWLQPVLALLRRIRRHAGKALSFLGKFLFSGVLVIGLFPYWVFGLGMLILWFLLPTTPLLAYAASIPMLALITGMLASIVSLQHATPWSTSVFAIGAHGIARGWPVAWYGLGLFNGWLASLSLLVDILFWSGITWGVLTVVLGGLAVTLDPLRGWLISISLCLLVLGAALSLPQALQHRQPR
jgi:hypothetical protein